MRFVRIALGILALLRGAQAAATLSTRGELQQCVEAVFKTDAHERIVTPSNSTYTDARLGEKIQFEQYPLLIAYAVSADEVGPLIACAQAAGIKAVPRNGGHSFEAYSSLNGTLVIDIGHLDSVKVSSDRSSATVGGGIRLGALYMALDAYNVTFNGGICPTVGLSGFLGSGGFTMQMRELGLGVDHVLSAKVVNAKGKTLTASPTTNSDLFFAIRGGGGGTYGIVTEWNIGITSMPQSAMVMMTWNNTAERYPVAQRFLEWAPAQERTFMSQVNVYKSQAVVLGWHYGATQAELESLIATSGLPSIGNPEIVISGGCDTDNSRIFGYTIDKCVPKQQVDVSILNVVPQAFAPFEEYPPFTYQEIPLSTTQKTAPGWPRFRRISKSFFVQKDKRLSNSTLEEVVDRIGQLDEESEIWGEWHAWNITTGSPSNGKPVAKSAFAWREQALAHLEFQIHGSANDTQNAVYEQWMANLESFLRPAVGPASYPGYLDTSISTEPLTSYYGDNVCRLVEIKQKYDPSDFFTNPLSIPLKAPPEVAC